jgi:hypothetical protein
MTGGREEGLCEARDRSAAASPPTIVAPPELRMASVPHPQQTWGGAACVAEILSPTENVCLGGLVG